MDKCTNGKWRPSRMQKGLGNGEVKRKFHSYGLVTHERIEMKGNDLLMDKQQQVHETQEEDDK